MSPVLSPAELGTMEFRVHVLPPFVETYIGALLPPIGSGVNAVAAICVGSAGLTARLASLSSFNSPLRSLGIILTTAIIGFSYLKRRIGRCQPIPQNGGWLAPAKSLKALVQGFDPTDLVTAVEVRWLHHGIRFNTGS